MRRREEPVRLTRIYTRGGDAGETSLGDGSRVRKTDARVAALGDVDELNSLVGWAAVVAEGESRALLEQIQNELFDAGADLSVPPGREALRVTQAQVDALERECDSWNERLEPLKSFVLPAALPRACGLPPRRARGARGRRARQACHGLPQPAVRSPVHPRSRGQPRRGRVPLEAWRVLLGIAGSQQALDDLRQN